MTRPIDTIRISRADTLLGTPAAQQTGLQRKKATGDAAPMSRLSVSTQVESSTHKPKTLLEEQVSGSHKNPRAAARQISETSVAATKANHKLPSAPALPARSTQAELTPAGKLLHTVLTQYPSGAGPLRGDRPLFVNAVMMLRASALERALLHTEGQAPKQQTSGQTLSTSQSTASSAAAPRPATSSALSAALMQTLQESILQSGLFYEAQLVRAILGNHPDALEKLRNQPQAIANSSRADEPSGKHTSEDTRPAPEQEKFRAVIRQQIELLSTQTVHWQGQPWPQASMDWTIYPAYLPSENPWSSADTLADNAEASQHQSAEATSDETPWCSSLTLQLPMLGAVQVHLWILNNETKIRISSAEHHQDLKTHASVLIERLEQSGIQTSQLEVTQHTVLSASDSGTDQ